MTFHFHFPSDCKINGIGGIASYLFTLCFEFSRSRSRPGLPRSCRWRATWQRRLRLQLGFDGRQYPWPEFAFRRDVALFQLRVLSRLRSSVALPLGINAPIGRSTGSLYPIWKPRRPAFECRAARPGLPRLGLGWNELRRQSRIQLVFRHERHPRFGLEFPFTGPLHQQFGQPHPWFSVALPLGINGDARHSKDGRGTFIGVLCGPKPAGFGVEAGSKRRCASLRGGEASARATLKGRKNSAQTFGALLRRTIRSQPIAIRRQRRAATSSDELQTSAWGDDELCGSASRKCSAQLTTQISWVRAARSPGGPKAQRASPAVLRTAKATPLCYEVRPRRTPTRR